MRVLRLVFVSFALIALAACASSPGPASQPRGANGASAPTAPVYLLADILGAAPQRLDALLGAPSLTRREGDGEYRRYALSTCMLIVIVYPDAAGQPKVAHVDAATLSSGAQKPDLESCLARG